MVSPKAYDGSEPWPVYAAYKVKPEGSLGQTSDVVVREYSPGRYPELLADLAKASDGGRDAIESFATRWGLLGIAGRETRREPVEWFVAHARGISLCFALLDLLYPADGSPFDAVALAEFFAPLRGTVVEPSFMTKWAFDGPLIDRSAPKVDAVSVTYGGSERVIGREWPLAVGQEATTAKQIIADIVTDNTKDLAPRLAVVEGKLTRLQVNSALLGMVYWHMANLVEENEQLSRCGAQDCGAFFIKKHGRQRFCPPDPWAGKGAESRCARRDRAPKKKTRGAS